MATPPPTAAGRRSFTICVVGLSGTEMERGAAGVGKSCLCNRFVRPEADNYYPDHLSVLSLTDFGGRVINNDHWLFWGTCSRRLDDGSIGTFSVIEQTEFVDDTTFQPFRGRVVEGYTKRCVATKLASAEKLTYICTNQLGLEHEFEQTTLPEGRTTVDGFILVYDVSFVQHRPAGKQVDVAAQVLAGVARTKRPVVVAVTKNDSAVPALAKELDRLLQKKFAKGPLYVVETSAQEAVNVDTPFLVLAHLIDKQKSRPRVPPYAEAWRARQEFVQSLTQTFELFVAQHVTDYKAIWGNVSRQFQSARCPEYTRFVEVVGTDTARKLFWRHTRRLKEKHLLRRQREYLARLPSALESMLPDLTVIADRRWSSCQQLLHQSPYFSRHFLETPSAVTWDQTDAVDGTDPRIPYTFLRTSEAETCFRNHLNALHAEQLRIQHKREFQQLLETSGAFVSPGCSLQEVSSYFDGRACFSNLSDEDRHSVYSAHQEQLINKAKAEFEELLQERPEVFADIHVNHNPTPAEIQRIHENLKAEDRYQALQKVRHVQEGVLLDHISFLQDPSAQPCPAGESCTDLTIVHLLKTRLSRRQSWQRYLLRGGAGDPVVNGQPHGFQRPAGSPRVAVDHHGRGSGAQPETQVNLVIIGAGNLASQLTQHIRDLCVDDVYEYNNSAYSLDYRPVDGDITLPQNQVAGPSFKPQEGLVHQRFGKHASVSSL